MMHFQGNSSDGLMACRRKKIMEGVFKDSGNWRARFVRMHEEEQQQRAVESKLARLRWGVNGSRGR